MNRTGLIVALVVATAVGVPLALFPQLDLAVSALFYAVSDGQHNMFAWRLSPLVQTLRNLGLWASGALLVPAIAAVLVKLVLPRRKMLISGRAALFLIATMALGPGLLANVVLKDHWGRPRPIDVTQFGGDQHFVAWWDPRGDCPANCSFVSGDVTGAFWTLAPATLAPPPWRPLAYAAALAFGVAMSVLRIMAGAHFLTDTVFAGVFTFLLIWLTHGLIFRWPRTRLSADTVERARAPPAPRAGLGGGLGRQPQPRR
ncbi:MAG: phosphatase PAP2 family protein [Pseudolabrys sp.]|nr:phosphatase PAP2 family protein [Pseudolabrys sp.]